MSFTAEQLAWRRQGVGASEVPAILGLSGFASPLTVYRDKIGEAEPEPESEAAEWGRRLEPVIADAYADRNPGILLRTSPTLSHRMVAFLFATPDRIACRSAVAQGEEPEAWNVQIKNRNFFAGRDFGEEETDSVPEALIAQVQIEMEVADLPYTDCPVLFGGNRLRVYRVQRDRELASLLVDRVADFWENHVQKRQPPAAKAQDTDFLKRLYPEAASEILLDGSADLWHDIANFEQVKMALKDAEEAKEELGNRIRQAIGDGAGFTFPNGGKVTWKNNKDTAFTNWEQVARSLGSIVGTEEFQREVDRHSGSKPGARVLRVSLPKAKEVAA